MQKHINAEKKLKRISLAIVICTLVLVAALTAYAIITGFSDAPPADKEILAQRVEDSEPNSGISTVTEYFKSWSFPSFNEALLASVEYYFSSYYYTELRQTYELAKESATIFIKGYYNETDLKDKNAVTEAYIDSYILAVGDAYADFMTVEEQKKNTINLSGKFMGIGVTVSKDMQSGLAIVNSTVSGAPADKAGILAGDLILSINGILLSEKYNEALNSLRGEDGDSATIIIIRDSKEIQYELTLELIDDATVSYEMLEGSLGYIRISSFKATTASDFAKALDFLIGSGAKGIVFDLRSNTGGLLSSVSDVLSYLVPTGTAIATFSSDKAPLSAKHATKTEPQDSILSLPSVILCNNMTASASELFCLAMRDYDAMGLLETRIIGLRSFGKGVMQSTYSFNDGSALKLTTALYYSPLGKNCESVGVIPDKILNADDDFIASAIAELELLCN